VVVEYKTVLENDSGEQTTVPVFCSAHSNEPRQIFYDSLKFLWEHGFAHEHLAVPHPLFFSSYLNAVFYRGVMGNNLKYYLYRQDKEVIESMVVSTAEWFVKLHEIKVGGDEMKFPSGFIPDVVPGSKKVLSDIAKKFPHYLPFYERVYKIFTDNEDIFKNNHSERYLVHGDAHPDNIIRMSTDKVALIDFNDLSLGDFARDLGCFQEQLEYMGRKEGLDLDYINHLVQLFFNTYFAGSKNKEDADLKLRIENYYNWTMLRTTTYQLLSNLVKRDEGRIKKINHRINKLRDNLGIGL
jgi:hypothetical protein